MQSNLKKTELRPYLIIPKFIEQPTWGGSYISEMKGWDNLDMLKNKKIGQSYELFSGTKLAVNIFDTSDSRFIPEIGFPDTPETERENFRLFEGEDYINICDVDQDMPLLIKVNHSKGNSFQLHVKHGVNDKKWKPKAESWYYLEDGKLTFGIKNGIDVNAYKKACLEIDTFMHNLSSKIEKGEISAAESRIEARNFIYEVNPWQFVNVLEAKKYDIIDPSAGGIHHSWEQDDEKYPLGNVVYEVQEDVMDPVSTIRAFDQGKINDDGSIRTVHIEDYFKYLDTDPESNTPKRKNTLSNEIYSMEVVDITGDTTFRTENNFHHIFVRDGKIELNWGKLKFVVGSGHSIFVPTKGLGVYSIKSLIDKSVILRTHSNK